MGSSTSHDICYCKLPRLVLPHGCSPNKETAGQTYTQTCLICVPQYNSKTLSRIYMDSFSCIHPLRDGTVRFAFPQVIQDALATFRDDVTSREFPGAAFSPYKISKVRTRCRERSCGSSTRVQCDEAEARMGMLELCHPAEGRKLGCTATGAVYGVTSHLAVSPVRSARLLNTHIESWKQCMNTTSGWFAS